MHFELAKIIFSIVAVVISFSENHRQFIFQSQLPNLMQKRLNAVGRFIRKNPTYTIAAMKAFENRKVFYQLYDEK
jgi:hypothetical protein